ncbi:unnamed protein product [Cochlearia groenlandica]
MSNKTIKFQNSPENEPRSEEEEVLLKLKKEKELSNAEISKLKQELEVLKETHEKQQLLILKSNAQEAKDELEKQLKDSDLRILDSTKKSKELLKYQNVNGVQKRGLSNLRFESPSPRRHSLGGAAAAAFPIAPRRRQGPGSLGRTASDSANERRNQNESRSSSKFSGGHRV